jgi:hypothetical protein
MHRLLPPAWIVNSSVHLNDARGASQRFVERFCSRILFLRALVALPHDQVLVSAAGR